MGIDDAEEKLKSWGLRPVYDDDAIADRLQVENERLRAMVKEAYYQGYADGRHRENGVDPESLWSGSEIANRLG